MVDDWPGWIEVGLTVRVTVGDGGVHHHHRGRSRGVPLPPPQTSV